METMGAGPPIGNVADLLGSLKPGFSESNFSPQRSADNRRREDSGGSPFERSLQASMNRNSRSNEKTSREERRFETASERRSSFRVPERRTDDVASRKFDSRRIDSDQRSVENSETESAGKKARQEKAMSKFMDSLEGELGISPEAILQAMKNLNAQERARPLGQTVGKILSDLNLNDSESDKAAEIYSQLLKDSSYNAEDVMGGALVGEGSLKVLTAEQAGERSKQLRVAQLNSMFNNTGLEARNQWRAQNGMPEISAESLEDKLAKSFFGVQAANLPDAGKEGSQFAKGYPFSGGVAMSTQGTAMNPLVGDSTFAQSAMGNSGSGYSLYGENIGDSSAQGLSQDDADFLGESEAVGEFGTGSKTGDSKTGPISLAAFANGSVKLGDSFGSFDLSQGGGSSSGLSGEFGSSDASSFFGDSGSGQNGGQDSSAFRGSENLNASEVASNPIDGSGAEGEASLSDMIETQNQGFFGSTNTSNRISSAVSAATAGSSSLDASALDQAQDVDGVIKQADYLVKKGGGEMRIKMTPEGLGHLDLKVNVVDGKVDISMIAEQGDAKKALESRLNELKGSLSTQDLNVENIKVGLSQEAQNQKGGDRNEADNTYARELARDFMGSMRDQRQSGFDDFFKTPLQKYFNQNREDVDPIQVGDSNDGESSKASASEDRRLNLVA